MNCKLFSRLLISLLIAVTAVGCHSSRNAAKAPAQEQAVWQRVKVPVNLRIGSPVNASVSATATMVRDTSINISARFLGMEVFVLQASADTVLVVDKMHRQYISESLRGILANMPFGVADVQDLITGVPVQLPLSLLPNGYSCDIMQTDSLLQSVTVNRSGADPVKITYGKAVATPYGSKAASTAVEATIKDKKYSLDITWNWGKARWNNDVETRPVNLSGGYKKIDVAKASEVLKL